MKTQEYNGHVIEYISHVTEVRLALPTGWGRGLLLGVLMAFWKS